MASPPSPRLLCALIGDRLGALSARPLLRAAAPGRGHRRVTCQATRTLSSLVDALFNRRSRDDSLENNPRRLRPGKVSPRLTVPSHIQRPPYVNSRQRPQMNGGPEIHDEKGIECMRASGKLAAQVLKFAGTLVNPGITTDEIDKAVHQMIIDNGAYPSPLGYCGFPKSVCTSVNECICHGIPDSRPLEDGDIINIDVTVYLNGYHGDTSATFLCGDVDDEAKKLVQVTKESLDKAISICAPGVEINRIGRTIQGFYISNVLRKLSAPEVRNRCSLVLLHLAHNLVVPIFLDFDYRGHKNGCLFVISDNNCVHENHTRS